MESIPPRLKVIDLEERNELEPMLVKNPDIIEEGLKILTHQLMTESGPLDILAVDSEGVLVIIELKNEIDEWQLNQGVRYYDWVRNNLAWLARAYPQIDPTQNPRLILIAPNFSDELKRLAKYVNIDLELKQYHALELPDGKRTIICSNIVVEAASESKEILTIANKINLMEPELMKQLAKQCLDNLVKREVELRPIQGRWISVWYRNKRFMHIGFRKKFFVCELENPDGSWTNKIRIISTEDWTDLMKDCIEPEMKYIEARKNV